MDRSITTRRDFLGRVGCSAAAIAAGRSAQTRPSNERPNILWIMTDEQRTDSLRCYGNPWAHSPNFDRLAESGVLFQNAFVQSPICVPSRATMLTGKYGHTIEVLQNGYRLNITSWHRRQLAAAIDKMGHEEFERRVDQLGAFATAQFEGKYNQDLPPWLRKTFGWSVALAQLTKQLGIVGKGPQHRMFPEILADNGYQTASIGKLHHGAPSSGFQDTPKVTEHGHAWWFGLRKGLDPKKYGIVPLNAPGIFAGTFPAPASETESARWTDAAIQYLKNSVREPFLLRLSLRAPHTPVLPPEPYNRMFDPGDMPIPSVSTEELSVMSRYDRGQLRSSFSEQEQRQTWASYFGLAAFVDHEVGRLLDALRASPHADNTIVVFTVDHGAHLGEHDLYQKSTFYDVSARVPFLLSWPGRIPERRESGLVEMIDLAPTLLTLCGVDVPSDMEGQNLVPGKRAETNSREAVFSEIYAGETDIEWLRGERPGTIRRMIRTEEWNLSAFYPEDPLYGPDGSLYNLVEDPAEKHNLYYDPKYRDIVTRLRKQLIDWAQS